MIFYLRAVHEKCPKKSFKQDVNVQIALFTAVT